MGRGGVVWRDWNVVFVEKRAEAWRVRTWRRRRFAMNILM